MRSSISNSESTVIESPRAQLRVVESPVPRISPPTRGFERLVPALPWLRILLGVVSATFVLMFAWELEMRHLGLRAGDLDDGRAEWAVERRKVDAGPRDSVVIIGDSRILLDTDLATMAKAYRQASNSTRAPGRKRATNPAQSCRR